MAMRHDAWEQSTQQFTSRMPVSQDLAVKVEEHCIDDFVVRHRQDVLTFGWTDSPRSSRPTLSPLPAISHCSFSTPPTAIQSHQNTYISNIDRDVLPLSDSVSGVSTSNIHHSTPNGRFIRASPLESYLPSLQNTPPHGSLNSFPNRPRTSFPVFETTSELAAHHGIPHKLPPLPTQQIRHRPPVPCFDTRLPTPEPEQQSPDRYSPDPHFYFQNLMNDYLSMVAGKSTDGSSVPTADFPPAGAELSVEDATAAEHIVQSMLATPWSDFLTSPFESPFDDSPLETPLQDSAELDDFLTSPAVADFYPDQPLFPDLPLLSNHSYTDPAYDAQKMSLSTMQSLNSTPLIPNYGGLFAVSPYTPSMDSFSTPAPSSSSPTVPVPSRQSRTQKQRPTGTRKNVTPDALVPVDAPTQPRTYVSDSTTSRKALPMVFMRKRHRAVAFGEEEDELVDEDPRNMPPTSTEAEAIAAKRRQNTIAARRSRKRKLEYQRLLEENVEREKAEKEMWKERALLCKAELEKLGYSVPFTDEL